MILIVNKYLIAPGFKGISLWPFIIVRDKKAAGDKVLLNHERIHLKQQMELLVIPFYIWYFIDYSFKYLKYRNSYKAYLNICFEREAYCNEDNLNYCRHRRRWNFLNY